MSTHGEALFHSVFQLIEESKHDKKLTDTISNTIKYYQVFGNKILINFKNNISVTLINTYLDDTYKIVISDPSFYSGEDKDGSKVSFDRLRWYLKQIAEYKYE